MVDFQCLQRLICHCIGDDAVCLHLGKVPHTAEHTVGDTRCAPGTPGDLHGAGGLNRHSQDARAAGNDLGQLLGGVKLQTQSYAETVAQGRRKLAGPGGGPDKGKMRQVQPDRVSRRPLADDDVDGVVLHGGIENFLHGAIQAVNFIHKKNVIFL